MYSQNVGDAVRYSSYDPIGTARTLGVGSAFGAMGGDFSVIGINPAGIAEYRVGELNFTPSIASSNINAFFVDDVQNYSCYRYLKKSCLEFYDFSINRRTLS